MNDVIQQKTEANKLRKSGQIKEALPLYRELWEKTSDEFDGAGLLHCLRRLKLYDEAIVLADNLLEKYPEFDWVRNEVIWTYIQGKLNLLNEDTPIQTVVYTADRIMSLQPDGIATKTVVFKVLKSAKSLNRWKVVNEWVTKVDPSTLNTNSTVKDSDKQIWSDQSQWYNYRIRGLLEEHDTKEEVQEALSLSEKASQLFPRQSKFFIRLKALAYSQLGSNTEAAEIYANLCRRPNTDWWLLHEYAKLLQTQDHQEDALKLMYQAADSNHKLESMVTLFLDIGLLCYEMKKNKEARDHLVLCRYIRENKGWSIPEQIVSTLNILKEFVDESEPSSQKEAYDICRSEWSKLLHKEGLSQTSGNTRDVMKGLTGKVNSIKDDLPFCFIYTNDKQSFFCSKSELPPKTSNGDDVIFDAIPSYDKKKGKDSWKAANIRHTNV